MTKKILLIIGILVVIGAALFLVLGSKPTNDEGDSSVGFSIRDFLPFGKSDEVGTTTEPVNQGGPNEYNSNPINSGVAGPIPRLRKISNESVAGAVIFNTGTTSIVRFVEKGTGNVYEIKSNSALTERLTNTTIPKIIRALWLPDGSGFLAQTLIAENEIIETSFVKLNKNKASSTVEILTPYATTISKLPTNIKELTVKPDGSKIFYYTIDNSVSNWFVGNPDGSGATLVGTNPLTEWLPKWISGNTVIMQSKGSSQVLGFTYSFDVVTKSFKKFGVGVLGLSVNPNSLGNLSIISNGGSVPRLALVDNKNITTKNIEANTLAEKCVWTKEKKPTVYCAVPYQTPKGTFPDSWYKGLVSTEDFIQKMDLDNDIFYNTAYLTDLSEQKIDVADLSLSPDETHLIFRNKIDGFLWMLRIEE